MMVAGITILVFAGVLLICALESTGSTARNRFIGALLLGTIGGTMVDNHTDLRITRIERR